MGDMIIYPLPSILYLTVKRRKGREEDRTGTRGLGLGAWGDAGDISYENGLNDEL